MAGAGPGATAILWPTFVLVAIVFAVWFTLFVQRLALIRRSPPTEADMASKAGAQAYFAPVEMPASNLANLFEMPVLYFGLVPLLIATGHVTMPQIALAWAYVLLRAGHSIVHIGVRHVPLRFFIYLASCAALSAMWIGFAIDVAQAA